MSHDVQRVRAFEHPGAGRKRAKSTPKGRQVDPTAAHEIELLLGDRPRRRDLLIEHLHLIQDKYHQISAAYLAAAPSPRTSAWANSQFSKRRASGASANSSAARHTPPRMST